MSNGVDGVVFCSELVELAELTEESLLGCDGRWLWWWW